MNAIMHFLHMDGYGFYVWSVYLITFITLFCAWWLPFKKWRYFMKRSRLKKHYEPASR